MVDQGSQRKTKKTLIRHAAVITIAVALVFAAMTRLVSTFQYTDFLYDQARDAGRVMGMWHGFWPAFGPQPLHQPFGLPPLYYYLMLPSSAFGANPVFQALTNAILSFCSVIILMYLVYSLLESVAPDRRLLLAAAAGLWWSVSNVDIQLNNREWNPSLIPFFLLCFTALYAILLQEKLSTIYSVLAWVAFGAIAAILVSLHGTTFFVTPVVFLLLVVYYLIVSRRTLKKLVFPMLAAASFLVCLTPYWKTEVANQWQNTRAIIATVQANGSAPIHVKVDNARNAYLSLRGTMYFPNFTRSSMLEQAASGLVLRLLGLLFLLGTPLLAVFYFKGNRLLFGVFALYWLTYLIAAANYPSPDIHYRLPIVLAPMILAMVSLAYINYQSGFGKLAATFLVACMVLSVVMNGVDDSAYLQTKFGTKRLMTTNDMVNALTGIPYGAKVCGKEREAHLYPLMYLDAFVTKKQLQFNQNCEIGAYMIRSRYALEKATPLTTDIDDDLNVVSVADDPNTSAVTQTDVYKIERVKLRHTDLTQLGRVMEAGESDRY